MILTKDDLFENCRGLLSFNKSDKSFSPFFSSIGLGAEDGAPGIGPLWLHYNRETRTVFSAVVASEAPFSAASSDPFRLVCEGGVQLAFYGVNAFVCEGPAPAPLPVFVPADRGVRLWTEALSDGALFLRGYSETSESRDPDREVPFALALRVRVGRLTGENGRLFVIPENGRFSFAAVFRCLTFSRDEMHETLHQAPDSADEAAGRSLQWARSCVKALRLPAEGSQIPKLRAAFLGLLYNLTYAEGRLSRFPSAFPSRGTYPTHFLWDTCFQNLAYELMDPALAKELLLQNIVNQREDGKYGQFLCSTWERPHDSQPALIGWAGMRLVKKTGDAAFAETLFESIKRNNAWWLTARGTDTGLVYTLGGLETGQDDSPRFDSGPTIACDMNAYLLRQLAVAARLADMLGKPEAPALRKQAEDFAARMREVLYCEEDAIFYDLSLHGRKPVRIVSPAGLLPLWAADPLPLSETKRCIERHLLNPAELFGGIPFPSVAYTDQHYDPSGWWRGPTWAPEAYLMLETLERCGYREQADAAAKKLYDMMARDDRLSELFDSQTGEGLGAAQQGWTCAVFIRLCSRLNRN